MFIAARIAYIRFFTVVPIYDFTFIAGKLKQGWFNFAMIGDTV